MADLSELATSGEPKKDWEILKDRFKELVVAHSSEVEHADREMELVRFGEFSVPSPHGPVLFDSVRFIRMQYIDTRSPEEPFYFADTIGLGFGAATIYEITLDHIGGFGDVQTGGGSELYAISDMTDSNNERAARALVGWVVSVEGDLRPRADATFPGRVI